jgi:hypothetical protein
MGLPESSWATERRTLELRERKVICRAHDTCRDEPEDLKKRD